MAMNSVKRAMVDKTNSTVVIIVSVAAFIVIFSLVATKAFMSQAAYQNRVIKEKRIAVEQLKADVKAVDKLKESYDLFVSTPANAIGGKLIGNGVQDGDNAKIVLDALPSGYDFPALATSLDALLSSQEVKILNITGTDDEVTQSANQSSGTPQAVPIPFQASLSADYGKIQNMLVATERSIRPIQLTMLDLSGMQDNLTAVVSAQTYYQPAKKFNIQTKVVK